MMSLFKNIKTHPIVVFIAPIIVVAWAILNIPPTLRDDAEIAETIIEGTQLDCTACHVNYEGHPNE